MAELAGANAAAAAASAAPRLMFDDGSRLMSEADDAVAASRAASATDSPVASLRGAATVREFYEVDRLASEIRETILPHLTLEPDELLRVALQLPDALLPDAPDLCWEMEQALAEALRLTNGSLSPLVFCLGDTTLGECCADIVAAHHLQAHVLVHCGPSACLSPCGDEMPVLYSFGNRPMDVVDCVEHVLATLSSAAQAGVPSNRLLLLYQVPYAHAMEELQTRLSEQGDILVVMGQLPQPSPVAAADRRSPMRSSGCGSTNCCSSHAQSAAEPSPTIDKADSPNLCAPDEAKRVVAGLELPRSLDWPSFSLLFIGERSSREFLHASLRFHSIIPRVLAYDPMVSRLATDEWSSQCHRVLKRRFYLVQKARHARAVGVLVANASDRRARHAVAALLRLLRVQERSAYVFAVGKVNAAKLANFAEIDCFVLVACPGHALFHDSEFEREFATPLVTPLEMAVALGFADWGLDGSMSGYSLDLGDFLALAASADANAATSSDDPGANDTADSDAPFFSLVTGRYESQPSRSLQDDQHQQTDQKGCDLAHLPGQGVLTQYQSAAADFLQGREYRGLTPEAGLTPAQPAMAGQWGIASDYDNR